MIQLSWWKSSHSAIQWDDAQQVGFSLPKETVTKIISNFLQSVSVLASVTLYKMHSYVK